MISKNLTELMGGRLELGSVPNKGTTIIVTIPAIPATTLSLELLPPLVVTRSRSPQDDFNHQYAREGISGPLLTAPPSRQSSPAPTSPRPVRILIAEDNAINAKIAIKTVKKLGYETVHCWNGQQTLDYLIDDGNPPVDLILMDWYITMPPNKLTEYITDVRFLVKCQYSMATPQQKHYGTKRCIRVRRDLKDYQSWH